MENKYDKLLVPELQGLTQHNIEISALLGCNPLSKNAQRFSHQLRDHERFPAPLLNISDLHN